MLRFPLYAPIWATWALFVSILPVSQAQEVEPSAAPTTGMRGSLVEDRAARQLIEAGEARMDANLSLIHI